MTAYATAAAFGVPVADEVFGPWDRTGPPYRYPPEQNQLRTLFWDSDERLTPQVVALATRVFDRIAGDTDRVVSKHPHTMIDPDDFRKALPAHREIHLLRNPLIRLNSLFTRGWIKSIGERHDLPRFTLAAQRWLDAPARVVFEDLARDPRAFFGTIWDAWGWDWTDDHLDRALAYQRDHYHESSAKLSNKDPCKVLSERRFALPNEVIELYLGDPFVSNLMERTGWSIDPDDYRNKD